MVVQPGVEEKDAGCTEYDREKAKDLMASIKDFPNWYLKDILPIIRQNTNYASLVEDGVAAS